MLQDLRVRNATSGNGPLSRLQQSGQGKILTLPRLSALQALKQWFSAFMLQPLDPVPHAVVTPAISLVLLLLHNYTVATVTNPNVNICYVTPKGWPPSG